jgi:hypothetical protein
MKTQPSNTPTEFVNDSYEEIHLDGEWEMHPVEIAFEKNWHNFLEREYLICVFYDSVPPTENFDGGDETKTNGPALAQDVVEGIESRLNNTTPFSFRMMELPKAYYSSVQKLIDYINNTLEELLSDAKSHPRVRFAFDEVFDRVRLVAPRTLRMMTVESYLWASLGFSDQAISKIKYDDRFPTRLSVLKILQNNATLSPRLDDITVIYIYCDIVEYQLVADTRLPLIGIVVIDKNLPFGSMIRYVWKVTQPMKVVTNNIRNIRIRLATPQGKPIPFTRGATSLVLRFRRRGYV